MKNFFNILVLGGGAAGFFTAINIKEKNPGLNVAILEKGQEVLTKVRISGGGRCNVTNACNYPIDFLKHYPRGEKELRSPFQRFGNLQTIKWFENRGVSLKTQEDGRVFPSSDKSESIIHCFTKLTEKLNIPVFTKHSVLDFFKKENNLWEIVTNDQTYIAEKLIITTGSNVKIWQLLEKLGHKIITPTPSLFSFNIQDKKLVEMKGIAIKVSLKVKDTSLQSEGNMLITHWGLSGPAILKLSAWGSKILAEKGYNFQLLVNWLPDKPFELVLDELKKHRDTNPKKTISKNPMFGFTHRHWEYLVSSVAISETLNYAEISKILLQKLAKKLVETVYQVEGKSTFKDEFVTAGGINLKEVNFKTFESKLIENLYFAGEVLDIDAITGGFNFQNAWTGGWIVSESISDK